MATVCKMITVIITDRSTGKITRKKICTGPAPSTMAASSSSLGTPRDEGAEQQDAERQPVGDLDEDQAGHGLEQAEPCSTQMVGTMAGGTINPASTRMLINGLQRPRRRCQT